MLIILTAKSALISRFLRIEVFSLSVLLYAMDHHCKGQGRKGRERDGKNSEEKERKGKGKKGRERDGKERKAKKRKEMGREGNQNGESMI